MEFKEIKDKILAIDEMILIAQSIGDTNITLQSVEEPVKKEFLDRGYGVYTCERPRIGGHTKFIKLTMIDWTHMEVFK